MHTLLRSTVVLLATALAGPALGGQDRSAAGARSPAQISEQRGAYAMAVRLKIIRAWRAPDSVQPGQRCQVELTQAPGGTVIATKIAPDCQFDAAGKASLEQAVLKAQPLPYKGYEAVFQPSMSMEFKVS